MGTRGGNVPDDSTFAVEEGGKIHLAMLFLIGEWEKRRKGGTG